MMRLLALFVCVFMVGVTVSNAQQNGSGPGANNGNGNALANGIAGGNTGAFDTGSPPLAVAPVTPISVSSSTSKPVAETFFVTGLFVDFVKDAGEELVYPTLILEVDGESISFKAAPYQYILAVVDVTQWVPGETEITVEYVVNTSGENLIVELEVNDEVIALRDGAGHPAWKQWPFAEHATGQFSPQIDLATVQPVAGAVKSVSKGLASGKVRLHVEANGKHLMITVGAGMLLTLQGMELCTGDQIQAIVARHIRTREWVLLQIENPETGESVAVRNRFGHQFQLIGKNR